MGWGYCLLLSLCATKPHLVAPVVKLLIHTHSRTVIIHINNIAYNPILSGGHSWKQ